MISAFLKEEILYAVRECYPEVLVPYFQVGASEHADFASNIAMVLAGTVNEKPRDVAKKIQEALEARELFGKSVEKVEIAGPGFLNIMIRRPLFAEGLSELVENFEEGFHFLAHQKQNIEFISANPTGKLHIGHGRGAFYGDVLANILAYAGSFMTREFYVNNSKESKQIKELGKTALGEGEQYKTPALEKKIKTLDFEGLDETKAGLLLSDEVQKENASFVTGDLKISFDRFFDENEELAESGKAQNVLEKLRAESFAYEKDGAEWLKTSEYGDDDDRVLVRSDGTFSYFLSDIAYHDDKFSRGLDAVLNVWGADHGGHVKRMMAVKKMLDWPGEFQIFTSQLVMLKAAGGEREKMSKRAGNVVLLEELFDEVGLDVMRWFFLEKALSTQMDFDFALARENSEKNPVRYVQYAHARMCSIIEKSGASESEEDLADFHEIFKNEPKARALALKLLVFPDTIEEITRTYGVHTLTTYVYELATIFNQFYRDVRVIDKNGEVNSEALALVKITKDVLVKNLTLLGISAPEQM